MSAAEALQLRQLARLRPGDAALQRRLGNTLQAMGDLEGAAAAYRASLQLEPGSVRGHNNLGQVLLALGDRDGAVVCYQQAIALDGGYAIAHNNLGIVHHDEGAYEAAVRCFEKALSLQPAFAQAHHNCAGSLLRLGRYEAALAHCDEALAVNPGLPEAHCRRGDVLRHLNRLLDAHEAYGRAVQQKPGLAQAWVSLGRIMLMLEQPQEAVRYFELARPLQPELVDSRLEYGMALLACKQVEEAIAAHERVAQRAPQHWYLQGVIREARNHACDWRGLAEDRGRISDAVSAGQPATSPFVFLSLCDSLPLQLRCAQIYAAHEASSETEPEPSWPAISSGRRRLKIAYLSADFHSHATAVLMAGVFESHDRDRFETVAVSFGPPDHSPMRQRLARAFDHFLDVQGMDDAAVARTVRDLGVDIAIDLKGYTTGMRAGILGRRCAPIQVSYLGYPGTLGMRQMDYLIADRIVVPPEHAQHYSEKIIWLPDSYQCNDDSRTVAKETPSRAQAGLPDRGFVFCCFNNNYKITPAVFDIWMRLLREAPGSVLWLLGDNVVATRNLRAEAKARGVEPDRLVFAERIGLEAHLARHRLGDLFLDTLPYNAHTTASDALWAGLPVLTCLGQAFAGRVGASLLNAVGLPELIAASLVEYEARALQLVRDPLRLADLRARLARNRLTQPLFDTGRFCHHLEAAYDILWQRYEGGMAPDSFAVPRLAPAGTVTLS
jgi:protein O-GlcNAc transferase